MKLQFGLRTLAALVAACAVVVFGAKHYYDSLPGPLIPYGTDRELASAVGDAFENPPIDYKAIRPGGAAVVPSPAMKRVVAFGDEAIPVLVANLGNRDEIMRFQVYEMLAMLDAKSAVPELIDSLRYDDGADDWFIVAKLSQITDHPEGYRFYRQWWRTDIQKEATETYRRWYVEHQTALKQEPEPQVEREIATNASEVDDLSRDPR